MRILHLAKYYPPVPGGMERFLGDLVEAQRSAGRDVCVLAHGRRGERTTDDPPWLWRCPVWLRLAFAPISPTYPFWLGRAIKRCAPDVLHIHMPNLSAFWALVLPAARRLPWIVHWHSDVEVSWRKISVRLLYPYYRVLERAILEHAEVIVATSSEYLQASRPLARWLEKCRVVPLGLTPERLPAVPPESTHALWRGSGVRLLAIGRLTYYKGFETLIRAVSLCNGVELVIVGEGEERARLERTLDKAGKPSWIRMMGQVDDETCCRLLSSCDIYCLPSCERTEAFGIVLMEAMHYGKPIIASNLVGSGVTWVARHNDNAISVTPEDVQAWRDAVIELAGNPRLRASLGQRGAERLANEFGISGVAMQLETCYRLAMAGRSIDDTNGPTGRCHQPLIVIPARNEAACVGNVVARIRALGFGNVAVVDDGSSDGTAQAARDNGALVLTPPLPQGAWGAMQTGIRYAIQHGYPGVITMDADGQHEPDYLADLLRAGADADVVIGAYPQRGSRARKIAWAWFRRLTGFSIEDLTSGLRYYNRDACALLAGAEATLMDYQDIGVLLLLRHAGYRIREIPVVMSPRQDGPSRIFFSWWAVARYMAETTLLCLARWGVKSRTP